MVRKKQLQVLFYTLHIIYVFGENVIDISQTKTLNDLPEPLSSNEYATLLRTNNSYLRIIETSTEEFLDETPEFYQNELLLNDYLKHDNANILKPDTQYTFVKRFEHFFSSSNELESNEKIILRNESLMCDETERSNVRNLTIDSVGNTWIFLSWQPPCENTSGSLIYSIYVYSDEQCLLENRTIENNTRYNVTDLDPCSEYQFTVKVISKDTELDGVNVTGATSYNISEIGDIRELVAHTTISTITLSWKPPENYSTCIHNYLITQCFMNICNNTTIRHETYTSTNLDPCKEYFFIIRAVSYLVQSNGFNITLKTNSPKSSKPQYPTVEANAFFLFIHWQPPEVGAMCIKYYRVTISPQLTTKQIIGTNITINDLYACTPYFIYINVVDQDNNDGEMITIKTGTAQTVSRSPVLDTKEPIVTANDIILSWKIEKGNSNCTLKSLIAVCNATTIHGHGYEVVNRKTEVPIDSRIQDGFLIKNSIIEGVSPFTTYICWAYVINEAGNSELSNLISVKTLEDSK